MTVRFDQGAKDVAISWDVNVVKGDHTQIRAENLDTGDYFVRNGIANTGRYVFEFPGEYQGKTFFVVKGSIDSEDTGTVIVVA